MAAGNICLYRKFGHCKFLETCKLRHFETICEDDECDIEACNLRHPKECKYFRDFARCKFGDYCSFKHSMARAELDTVKSELENLKTKVTSLENLMNEKNMEMKQIQDNVTKLLEEKETNSSLVYSTSVSPSLSSSYTTSTSTNPGQLIPHQKLSLVNSNPSEFNPSNSTTTDCLTNSSNLSLVNSTCMTSSPAKKSIPCCNHRCFPGRDGRNRPPDLSKCCYHRCRIW